MGVAGKSNDGAQVDGHVFLHLQKVSASYQLINRVRTQLRHDAAQLLCNEQHKAFNIFGLADKFFAQLGVLSCDAKGTGAQMTYAHHAAAHGDQRSGCKAEFLCAQQQRNRNVMAAHQLAIRFKGDALTQTIPAKNLMCFRKTDFPGKSRMVNAAHGCCAGTTFAAGNQYTFCARLCNAAGNGSHASGRDQLDRHAGVFIGALKIVDQLRQILNGINIVMRRRRDQGDALRGTTGSGNFFGHLASGQMAALAGLRALRHLNLNLLRRQQIITGHAEAARSHLLDGGVEFAAEAFRQLSTLAAVGFAAQTVHGLRHALMGLLRNGAIGHRTSLKPFDDVLYRFHFLQRDGLAAVVAEVQQRSDGARSVVFNHGSVFIEQTAVVIPYRLLKRVDDFRRVQVFFRILTFAQSVFADAVQRIAAHKRAYKRPVVMPTAVRFDAAETGSTQIVWRVGEIGVHQRSIKANGLKQLRALISLQRGYAHLGRDLQHADGQRFIVVCDGLFGRFINLSIPAQLRNALMRQIGIDRARTIADQHSHLVDVTGFAALQNYGNGCSLFLSHQMLLQSRHSQQRRNGQMFTAKSSVGQYDDVHAVYASLVTGGKQMIKRRLKALPPRIKHAQRGHAKHRMLNAANAIQLFRRQDGRGQLDDHAVFRAGIQKIAVIADVDRLIGFHLLADGVDGRIGDLRKPLLKVGKQRRMRLRQCGYRLVCSHGNRGFNAVNRHGQKHIMDILVGVPEGLA